VHRGKSKKRLGCVMRIGGTPAREPGVIPKSECSLCDLSVLCVRIADWAGPYLKRSAIWSLRRNHWKADHFAVLRWANVVALIRVGQFVRSKGQMSSLEVVPQGKIGPLNNLVKSRFD